MNKIVKKMYLMVYFYVLKVIQNKTILCKVGTERSGEL